MNPEPVAETNAGSDHEQQAARVRKTIRETCCEHGEEPGFVGLHVYEFNEMMSAGFFVALPAGVQVLTRIEWRLGRWKLRRKRDPMAAFEIDVGDDNFRKAARILGAPADHVKAVLTPNIRKWILELRGVFRFSTTGSRLIGEDFERRAGWLPPGVDSGLNYCEVRIWIAKLPPEDVARMFASELIAIAQQFREPKPPPTMAASSGAFRGVQPVIDERFEEDRRRYEIEAYLTCLKQKPRTLGEWVEVVVAVLGVGGALLAIIFAVVVTVIELCEIFGVCD